MQISECTSKIVRIIIGFVPRFYLSSSNSIMKLCSVSENTLKRKSGIYRYEAFLLFITLLH